MALTLALCFFTDFLALIGCSISWRLVPKSGIGEHTSFAKLTFTPCFQQLRLLADGTWLAR